LLRKRGFSKHGYNPAEILHYIDNLNNIGYYHGQDEVIGADNIEIKIEEEREDDFWEFYLEYEQELHKANALDFGRLITAVIQLFEMHPAFPDCNPFFVLPLHG